MASEIRDLGGFTGYKVYVSVFGEDCEDHGFHTNGIVYASMDEAYDAGESLASRWTLVKEFAVGPNLGDGAR